MSIYCFEQLLPSLSMAPFGPEPYYNLGEAVVLLEKIGEDKVKICNATITPFYVTSDAILELYAFELTLAVVPEKNPIEVYLRQRTGYTDLSGINPHVISRLKHCYIETLNDDPYLTGNVLARFFLYLFSCEELRNDTKHIELFDSSKLYFSYFDETQKQFK